MTTAPVPIRSLVAEQVEREHARQAALAGFLATLRAGIDYGKITIGQRDSKPSLFKPGAERICLLYGWRPHFVPDGPTRIMAGRPDCLFAFICQLIDADGIIIGEGRGSAALGEKKGWTINTAVKIAEKRAQVDAVLRTAGLSDAFTQDLEDQVDDAPAAPALATPEQLADIARLLPLVGMTAAEAAAGLKVESLDQLTEGKAARVITRLQGKVDEGERVPAAEAAEPAAPIIDPAADLLHAAGQAATAGDPEWDKLKGPPITAAQTAKIQGLARTAHWSGTKVVEVLREKFHQERLGALTAAQAQSLIGILEQAQPGKRGVA